uniref:Uncharacterized protein n=1 Tax=Arundo donax TaxID=35708 RepID=A0A0A9G0P7_ARUDO
MILQLRPELSNCMVADRRFQWKAGKVGGHSSPFLCRTAL